LSIQLQLLGVSFFILAAMICIFSRRAKRESMTLFEMLWSGAALCSFIAAIIAGNGFVFSMTLVSSAVFISVAIIRRSMSFEELAKICAYTFCIIIPIALLVDFSGYLSGISGEGAYGIGLLRFSPLGLHPNLTGFIFGFGTLLNLYFFHKTLTSKRFVFLGASFLCLTFVMAASSRAGLLAIFGAILIAYSLRFQFEIKVKHLRTIKIALFSSFILIPVFIYSFPDIAVYIEKIIDLNSETRGISSGGTGRVDLWLLSVHEIQNRGFFELLFGSGFRSSSKGLIGYSTESSYFTLILENGLMLTLLFIPLCFIWGVAQLRNAPDIKNVRFLIGTLIVFVFIQSVFNRYMVAFGNPVSLLILVAYFGARDFGKISNRGRD